jgi:prevent-host-death family protein
MTMRTVPAGEFKTHCLRIMEEVRRRREPVLITKKGIPIAKLVPSDEGSREVFDCLRGRLEIVGDLVAPIGEEWEASR